MKEHTATIESERLMKDALTLSAAKAHIVEEKAADAHDEQMLAQDWQALARDWQALAHNWQTLVGTIEQFEKELDGLEADLNRRRRKRGSECVRWKRLGLGPISS